MCWPVVTEQLSDSDSDQEELLGPSTHDIFIATSTDADDIEGDIKALDEVWVGVLSRDMPAANRFTLALSDTCCARTVAGEKWVRHHLDHLHRLGEDTYVVEESRPFRFGAGPRVMSSYAVILPINIKGANKWAHIRVSVVDQDVPLLISKTALKELGVVLDLVRGCVCFGELSTDASLRETATGLCGFDINLDASRRRYDCPSTRFLDEECEVVLSEFDMHPYDEVWMTSAKDENQEVAHQGHETGHTRLRIPGKGAVAQSRHVLLFRCSIWLGESLLPDDIDIATSTMDQE